MCVERKILIVSIHVFSHYYLTTIHASVMMVLLKTATIKIALVRIPIFCNTNLMQLDINECLGDMHGCEQECNNTEGGYQCSCTDGFNLVDQHNCTGKWIRY